MARKARKKSAAKAKKTKKKPAAVARKKRKVVVKKKAKRVARKKAAPKAKPKGIIAEIVGAAGAVVDTLAEAESLHHKMEPRIQDPE
jgi:hypothetical protein